MIHAEVGIVIAQIGIRRAQTALGVGRVHAAGFQQRIHFRIERFIAAGIPAVCAEGQIALRSVVGKRAIVLHQIQPVLAQKKARRMQRDGHAISLDKIQPAEDLLYAGRKRHCASCFVKRIQRAAECHDLGRKGTERIACFLGVIYAVRQLSKARMEAPQAAVVFKTVAIAVIHHGHAGLTVADAAVCFHKICLAAKLTHARPQLCCHAVFIVLHEPVRFADKAVWGRFCLGAFRRGRGDGCGGKLGRLLRAAGAQQAQRHKKRQ